MHQVLTPKSESPHLEAKTPQMAACLRETLVHRNLLLTTTLAVTAEGRIPHSRVHGQQVSHPSSRLSHLAAHATILASTAVPAATSCHTSQEHPPTVAILSRTSQVRRHRLRANSPMLPAAPVTAEIPHRLILSQVDELKTLLTQQVSLDHIIL